METRDPGRKQGMKAICVSSDDPDVLTLDSCEDGLDFIAYALREDLAQECTTECLDLREAREIAIELLTFAAKSLGRLWNPSPTSEHDALGDLRFLRLLRSLGAALHPMTSRKQLAEEFQSAADLIRMTRLQRAASALPLTN